MLTLLKYQKHVVSLIPKDYLVVLLNNFLKRRSLMANKKVSTISADGKNVKIGDFQPLKVAKRSGSETAPETFKTNFPTDKYLPIADAKSELSEAISKAIKHDAQTVKFSTVKETKQRRRDIIVNTIMRHARKTS